MGAIYSKVSGNSAVPGAVNQAVNGALAEPEGAAIPAGGSGGSPRTQEGVACVAKKNLDGAVSTLGEVPKGVVTASVIQDNACENDTAKTKEVASGVWVGQDLSDQEKLIKNLSLVVEGEKIPFEENDPSLIPTEERSLPICDASAASFSGKPVNAEERTSSEEELPKDSREIASKGGITAQDIEYIAGPSSPPVAQPKADEACVTPPKEPSTSPAIGSGKQRSPSFSIGDLKKKDHEGRTVVFQFVKEGNFDGLMGCYEVGPNSFKATDGYGDTVIHAAAKLKGELRIKMLQYLLSLQDVKPLCLSKNKQDENPMHIAASKGDFDVLELLFIASNGKKGGLMSQKNKKGKSPNDLLGTQLAEWNKRADKLKM